ncbi:hypothetical protein [Jannaschia ovalis]|uniref:Lipoprotein n=1 Tax=Jannaschia ovalis TaxID=3038773 RepID=A0ABY8LA11_9RHOB|nr:hypothetical protein [Jannaschia sp. GRR-S6-38]WGH78124.1 hypothetical protein P8627_13965 [Jannaschia sp. GRR-S6-38]
MKTIERIKRAVWTHRATYAGLALAYGAGCLGLIDKATVSQIATACYVALVVQAH